MIQYLNEKLGIPSNVISIASMIFNIPLVSATSAALTFFSLFALLWGYYYKTRSIESLKEDDLEKEEVELIVENDKIGRDLQKLYEIKRHLEEELKKAEGIIKDTYSTELESVTDRIKKLEAMYEENLIRLLFVRKLKILISYKKFLKEKGVWKKFDELSKKIEKEKIEIDRHLLKRKEIKEFLSSLNIETDVIRFFGIE